MRYRARKGNEQRRSIRTVRGKTVMSRAGHVFINSDKGEAHGKGQDNDDLSMACVTEQWSGGRMARGGTVTI